MRRALALPLICAALALSAVGLLRAADGPAPFSFFGLGPNDFQDRVLRGDPPRSQTPARAPNARAAPASAPPRIADEPEPGVARGKLLNDLFSRLKKSRDDAEAFGVAGAIQRVWLTSGSDTADLLMGRVILLQSQSKFSTSEHLLRAIVKIEPTWSQAWNELAVAAIHDDDDDEAMIDLAHALALEPRHFRALTGLGLLLERNGDDSGALRVFRKVVEIYPRLQSARNQVDRLTIKVEGRPL